MFYLRVNSGHPRIIGITPANVFSLCPVCGQEVQVNLQDYTAHRTFSLSSSQVMCPRCTAICLKRRLQEMPHKERPEHQSQHASRKFSPCHVFDLHERNDSIEKADRLYQAPQRPSGNIPME